MKPLPLFVALLVTTASADWLQFRGPNAQGIAPGPVPLTWSDTENLTWNTTLPGPGASSPIISGEHVFVTCFTGESADELERHLVCLSREDGDILWIKTVPGSPEEDPYQGFITEHGYASNTPTTDGQTVYAFFGKSGVYAYDFDGNEKWHNPVGTMSSNRRWGSAASPVLVGDQLVVNASDEARAVYAFDKTTGEQSWKAEADMLELSYATPVLRPSTSGESTDLVLPVPGELWGLNPETGKLRWYATTGITGNVTPSAVLDPTDASVYLNGGYPATRRAAITPAEKGETPADNTRWEESNASYVPTPVLYQGHLYWVSDQGYALCSNAKTGELIYKERLEQIKGAGGRNRPVYASPVLVDGHLIAVTRHAGTIVIKATPEFTVTGHNTLESDSTQFNATPAVSAGQLFLRSDSTLYCLGQRKKSD